MKHYKYFLILFFVVSIFSSCEEEEDVPLNGVGVSITPSNSSFTYLDDIIIDLEVEGASTVSVANLGGSDLGEVSISDGQGTFETVPGNINFNEDGVADIEFSATYNGDNTIRKIFEISIGNPVSVVPPSLIQEDSVKYFNYTINTANAESEEVVVETRVNSQDYTEEEPGDWATGEDSLGVNGIDYSPDDTVWFKVSATRGDSTAMAETFSVVGVNELANVSSPITFQGDTAYDLVSHEYVTAGTDTSDMEFNLSGAFPGENFLGFESNNGTMFVEGTIEEYETGNSVHLREKFESSNEKVSSVNDVDIDDVYLYGTTRDGETHIGILRITDTYRSNNDDRDTFTFQYKY